MSIFRRGFSIRQNADPKSKWKDIQENYDHHHNKRVSAHVHRGDLSPTTRLLAYSDAMMATCATFLVIPIKYNEHSASTTTKKPAITFSGTTNNDAQTLLPFLASIRTEILMFFIGFLLVATIWESLNIRSIVIKRLDDFLVLLSIVQMLFASVLPFSVNMQGHFPGNRVAVLATTTILLCVEVMEACIIMYAFSSPRLLHIEMKDWPRSEVRSIKNALLSKNLINIAIISTGALCEFFDYRLSWVFFCLLILNPIVRKVYLHMKRKRDLPETEHTHFYWFMTKGNISKERVEGFTDAATAIIACVMILDIVIEQFSKLEKVPPENLWKALKVLRGEFSSFLVAYIAISLLWYVNHTVVHLFHTINVVLLYLQKFFLCFLALCPLCANIATHFTREESPRDTKVVIHFISLVTFFASLCNLLMVLWGYYTKEKVFHSWAVQSNEHSRRQQLYTKLKVANMPFWSLISFIGAFGSVKVAETVAIASYLIMTLSFIVLKLIFVNHVGKEERTKELRLSVKSNRYNVKGMSTTPEDADGHQQQRTNPMTREPSESTIARHGESELTVQEDILEQLMNVEFDGNEVINNDETLIVDNSNVEDGSVRLTSYKNKAFVRQDGDDDDDGGDDDDNNQTYNNNREKKVSVHFSIEDDRARAMTR